MKKNDLVEKIENAFEMVFSVNGRKFTVTDEEEKGFSIAEWYKQETEKYFKDAQTLADNYMIDGKTVAELSDSIKIEEYTGVVY